MKRLSPFVLLLAALMVACNFPSPETPAPVTGEPPPGATDTVAVPATPTVELVTPTVQPSNVQCNELSFYLDPAAASSYTCETVPETIENDPFQFPQYTSVTLEGYVLPGESYFRRIHVYRLAEFLALRPQASTGVDELKTLIAGGAPGVDALPVMDLLGAAQEFHAQYRVVAFAGGSGIRFISQYAQYYAPINNHDMFLIFQGLTSDEQYYISAILRISNPILPANPLPLPGGVTDEAFANNFAAYIADITGQLNAQPEASFLPSITLLDALIQSISITP
ncbi:MAG: hypothetical protein JW748_09675 [Anaerolineales bacterium]|nr:hypothetical protein [Anaerolineales bacterium]